MADKEHTYGGQWKGQKKIKLKDLIKTGGMEVIPNKWVNQESPKRDATPDLVLPVDKEIILKADTPEAERGLVIKWKKSGGYDIYYWYDTPDKAVPAELKADGKSKGKSVKKVHLGYHPEIDD